MAKKKIIAIGATAAAVVLAAGVGVAYWAFGGATDSPGDNVNGGSTLVNGNADWGTIAVADGNKYTLVFDQKQIFFGNNVTIYGKEDPNANYVEWKDTWNGAEWNGAPLYFKWNFDGATTVPTEINGGNVEYYISFFLNDDIADYVTFKEGHETRTSEDTLPDGTTGQNYAKYKVTPIISNKNSMADDGYARLEIDAGGYLLWNEANKPTDATGVDDLQGLLSFCNPYVVNVLVEAVKKA